MHATQVTLKFSDLQKLHFPLFYCICGTFGFPYLFSFPNTGTANWKKIIIGKDFYVIYISSLCTVILYRCSFLKAKEMFS